MDFPIIDSHCHIYPEAIATRAVSSVNGFYSVESAYDGRYSTLIEEGGKNGISHYVIFSVATTPHQVHSINSFISDTVRASQGAMTGLGTLHPESESLACDIAEIRSRDLKGIKLHPDFQKFCVDSKKAYEIYENCGDDLIVLLHTGDTRYDFSNPERMKRVLTDFPHIKFVGAHFGGWSCWQKACDTLCGFDNFYVDCSSSFNWLGAEQCRDIVRAYGKEKVLFATDFPMWSYETELKKFFDMSLTDEENRLILYKNAAELFGILL